MKNAKILTIKINIKFHLIILSIYSKKFAIKIKNNFHLLNFINSYMNVKNSMEMKYIVLKIFYMKN